MKFCCIVFVLVLVAVDSCAQYKKWFVSASSGPSFPVLVFKEKNAHAPHLFLRNNSTGQETFGYRWGYYRRNGSRASTGFFGSANFGYRLSSSLALQVGYFRSYHNLASVTIPNELRYYSFDEQRLSAVKVGFVYKRTYQRVSMNLFASAVRASTNTPGFTSRYYGFDESVRLYDYGSYKHEKNLNTWCASVGFSLTTALTNNLNAGFEVSYLGSSFPYDHRVRYLDEDLERTRPDTIVVKDILYFQVVNVGLNLSYGF
jgi:hypothetical protein